MSAQPAGDELPIVTDEQNDVASESTCEISAVAPPDYGSNGANGEASPRRAAQEEEKLSTSRTLMNFIKGMIDSGCLALPMAIKMAGTWTGLALVIIISGLNMHCMTLLVETAQYLCKKSGSLALDYGHLAKKVVDYGPVRWRGYSKQALYTTNIIISVLQLAVCSVGLVFMSTQISNVLEELSSRSIVLSTTTCMLIVLPILILLNFIRSVNMLAILSTMANALMICVFCVIAYALIITPPIQEKLPAYTNIFNMSMAIGSILYAFEGQAIILPLENTMKHPEDMLGWTGVLCVGMALVTAAYAATGLFGYLAYGSNVQASITFSLNNFWLYDATKLLLVLAIFATFTINQYVVVKMLTPGLHRKCLRPHLSPVGQIMGDYSFRLILVFCSFLIAVLVPNLQLIISIVGITVGAIIAFVFPPIMHTVAFWDIWKVERSSLYIFIIVTKNMALVVMGVVGVGFGVYSNLVVR